MFPSASLIPLDEFGRPEPVTRSSILKLLKLDESLPANKKKSLMEMLASPEAFDHIMFGLSGMAIARAATSYMKLSKPARILLGLSGFSLGNVIYNHLFERKHTTFDRTTGKSKILL